MNKYFETLILFAIGMFLALLVFYLVYRLYLYISINLLLDNLIKNGSTTLKW